MQAKEDMKEEKDIKKGNLFKMAIIQLNDGEQQICQFIANCRANENDRNGVQDRAFRDIGNYETHLQGFGAEMAFAKMINVYPDFSYHLRNCKNDIGDLRWNDKSIDVKTTQIPNGRLITPYWKVNSKIDIYVLMVGQFPNYEYKGYLYREEFIRQDRLRDLGHGATYVAEQRELRIN